MVKTRRENAERDKFNKELGKRIRDARMAANMTAKELGTRLGIDESVMVRYERGEIVNVNIPFVVDVAKILGIQPAQLMGWSKISNPTDILSADERMLVSSYRTLNPDGKQEVQAHMDYVKSQPRYTKDTTVTSALAGA